MTAMENEALEEFIILRRRFNRWLATYQSDIKDPKLVRDFGVICELLAKFAELLEEATE